MEERYKLVQMDAVEFLNSLEPESVDLGITDPAYESLEKHRAKGTTTRLKVSDGSSNEWFPIFRNGRFDELFVAYWRVLKKNAHLYVYCDEETADIVKPICQSVGFKFWKRIIWDKMKIGMGYHYRARCEYILFFEKGKRRLHDLGMPDVWDFREDPAGWVMECKRVDRGYPTEKPVETSRRLIVQSSDPGDVVVDVFMGSASVGEAALRMGRRFMGCDVADRSIRESTERLARVCAEADAAKQLEIFKEGAE
jgi:site-specific DNA-methyltransferase (adenine-specific)